MQNQKDRDAVVVALANNGYAAVVEVEDDGLMNYNYYVIFNIYEDEKPKE